MIARVLVLITLVCGYAAARYFDVDMYLSLMGAQMLLDTLAEVVHAYPFMSILSYVLVYVVTTAFSIPGGAVLTMLGGALFGAFLGTFLAVIGATIGGLLAFLSARFVVGDILQARYATQLARFNAEIVASGKHYLLTLRLLPVFPFFLVNLLAGLSVVSISTFVWTTIVGIIPGTFVYAFAGKQLAAITDLSMLLTPGVVAAFTLLGVLALAPVLLEKRKRRARAMGSAR